jgi:hypothetical protein
VETFSLTAVHGFARPSVCRDCGAALCRLAPCWGVGRDPHRLRRGQLDWRRDSGNEHDDRDRADRAAIPESFDELGEGIRDRRAGLEGWWPVAIRVPQRTLQGRPPGDG